MRVIVTPNNRQVAAGNHIAAAVGIAQKRDSQGSPFGPQIHVPRKELRLFHWFAISDVPQREKKVTPFVRMRSRAEEGVYAKLHGW